MAAPRTSKLSNGMTSNNKKAVIILVFLALVLMAVVCLDSVLQSQQDVSTLTALLTDPSTTSKNSVRQGSSRTTNNRKANPLLIPQGTVPNLPSIRVEDKTSSDNVDAKREIYGGAGDKSHLGGFTQYDGHGVSPNTWTHMMQDLNVRSVMDIGCGRGISSSWFLDHGIAHTLCVEGSHDAYERTLLPDRTTQMVEHDYSRGPWWPKDTYDAAWAVEFLEHVGVNYHYNYISTMRKAALLFVTSSRWGGWHHVEVHTDDWWILKYESYGFEFSRSLTDQVRSWARQELTMKDQFGPDGKNYNAQHVWLTLKVFVNPQVLALPEHAHLLYPYRCGPNRDSMNPKVVQVVDQLSSASLFATPCNQVSATLQTPPVLTPAMQQTWLNRVQQSLQSASSGTT